jgi:hypothetical protein
MNLDTPAASSALSHSGDSQTRQDMRYWAMAWGTGPWRPRYVWHWAPRSASSWRRSRLTATGHASYVNDVVAGKQPAPQWLTME